MKKLYLAFLLGLGLAACAKEKEAVDTSETIEVSYSAEAFPSEIGTWFIGYDMEKNIATILVRGRDKRNPRDDAGIQKIVLFEDGSPIDSTEEGSLRTKLSRPTGIHTYFAEITNNSGLIARTGVDSVGYVSTR